MLKANVNYYCPSDSHGNNFESNFLCCCLTVYLKFVPVDTCSSPRRMDKKPFDQLKITEQKMVQKRILGGIIQAKSLKALKEKRDISYPLSFTIYNTKPVGHQVVVLLKFEFGYTFR